MKQKKLVIVLAFLTIYCVWGSTFLAIRFALDSFPPFLLAAVRFILSGLLLGIPAWYISSFKQFTRKEILMNSFIGILLAGIGNGALVWAVQGVTTGTASLWIAAVPICILVFNWAFFDRKRPPLLAIMGALLGCVGVSMLPAASVIIQGKYPHVYYLFSLVLSVTSWSLGTLLQRRIGIKEGTIWHVSALHMFAAGCFLMLLAIGSGELGTMQWQAMTAKSVTALAYLILIGSILAFSAYAWLITVVNPQKVATYAMVNPVLALILGASLAGEKITFQLIQAACVVLCGVGFIMFSPKRA